MQGFAMFHRYRTALKYVQGDDMFACKLEHGKP